MKGDKLRRPERQARGVLITGHAMIDSKQGFAKHTIRAINAWFGLPSGSVKGEYECL